MDVSWEVGRDMTREVENLIAVSNPPEHVDFECEIGSAERGDIYSDKKESATE